MSDSEQDQSLPEITRINVTPELLSSFSDEQEFVGLAVDLMVEFGSWLCVAASLLPGDTRHWSRNQAILGGSLVRAYKLSSGLLDQTCQHRCEIMFILGRLLFESFINIQYLIKKDSGEIFQAFVIDSLRHEKRLMDRIGANIVERGGDVLPIETRMLDSIARAFEKSEVKPEEVTKEAFKPWKDVDLYQRANAVGFGEAYLGLFGGASHHVHGSWQDILEYHLQYEGGGFSPELDWHLPRPQVLYTLARVGLVTVKDYLEYLVGERADGVVDQLGDLWDRIDIADKAHEALLSASDK